MSRQNIKKVIFFRSDSIHTYSRVTVDQNSIYRRPWSEQRYSFQSFLIIGKKIKSYTHRTFPSGNFPNVQFPMRQLLKAFLAAAIGLQSVPATPLGLLAHPSHSALPPLQLAAPQKGWPNLWEVSGWEIADMGSFYLGNCHLGSRPWENAFGMVPNKKCTLST